MLAEEIVEENIYVACDCPIVKVINVMGGKWKPVIIWLLIPGPKRFGALHKSIDGIALKVLSRQLKELEADGIISRKVYAEVPPRVEYALTAKGQSLSKAMEVLSDWGRENIVEAG